MTHYLPVGHKIKDRDRACEYTVKGILGRGASTIAYLTDFSDDSGFSSERILKEYCPSSITITREGDGALLCDECCFSKYQEGLVCFRNSGSLQNDLRKRTCFKNETPPLQRIFEANNTCYLDVVPFAGRTLDKMESLTLLERMKICLTVAKVIEQYHENGLLYLDLKPENIFVLTNAAGEAVTDLVVLVDFDSVIEKDKVTFGKSLSFTKSWAAPEQINPHGFKKISEATDVYALGELVFWCVFGRHSSDEEHRGFSEYPFGDGIRYIAQRNLTKLFHNTLRPSPRNRYRTMRLVVDSLTESCELLSAKEYIIASEVRPNEFFVGRTNECCNLATRLEAERLIFLCGMGGIGKSEIAKQHAIKNKQKYSNILYFAYTGDFEETICQDHVSIATVERMDNESNHHFCWRKLHAIKRCLHGNNLIIIDNLNSRLEDIEHQSVWEFLRSLPCEIIVTTRAEQTEHILRVEELADINALRSIYLHNCPYTAQQEPFVDEIIQRLNRHTLLTELIAKQTRAAMCTPQEMLDRLQSNGIHSLNKETVGIQKDDQLSRETVFHHTRTLFAMSSMTYDQQLTITKAAFMPETGIMASDFTGYHAIESHNTINWLVDNGWLYCSKDSSFTLSIHPVIAEIAIENAKSNPDLLQVVYNDAMKALSWKTQTISHKAHELLCNAIVSATNKYSINHRSAAEYLIRHAGHSAVRSNHNAMSAQLKRAMTILEDETNTQQYSALLEYAYLCYIRLKINPSGLDDSIRACEEHLRRAKKVNDLYMTARFLHLLSRMYTDKFSSTCGCFVDIVKMLYYYYASIFCWSKLDSDTKRKTPKYVSKDHLLHDLDYGYLADSVARADITFRLEIASDLENMNAPTLFCSKLSVAEAQSLQKAVRLRRYLVRDCTLRPTPNSVEIVVDEARILFHQGDFCGAKQKLLPIVEMYTATGLLPDLSLYRVHQFLGNLAAITGDFETAVKELKRCMEIDKELQFSDSFLAKVQLGRFLNETGDVAESERLNTDVLSVVEELDADTRKSYYADALYNYASLQMLKGDSKGAIATYIKAYNEYCHCSGVLEFSQIGRARCCRKLCEIYYKIGKIEKAEQEFKLAKEKYIDCLGDNHPEVQDFLRQSPIK